MEEESLISYILSLRKYWVSGAIATIATLIISGIALMTSGNYTASCSVIHILPAGNGAVIRLSPITAQTLFLSNDLAKELKQTVLSNRSIGSILKSVKVDSKENKNIILKLSLSNKSGEAARGALELWVQSYLKKYEDIVFKNVKNRSVAEEDGSVPALLQSIEMDKLEYARLVGTTKDLRDELKTIDEKFEISGKLIDLKYRKDYTPEDGLNMADKMIAEEKSILEESCFGKRKQIEEEIEENIVEIKALKKNIFKSVVRVESLKTAKELQETVTIVDGIAVSAPDRTKYLFTAVIFSMFVGIFFSAGHKELEEKKTPRRKRRKL